MFVVAKAVRRENQHQHPSAVMSFGIKETFCTKTLICAWICCKMVIVMIEQSVQIKVPRLVPVKLPRPTERISCGVIRHSCCDMGQDKTHPEIQE